MFLNVENSLSKAKYMVGCDNKNDNDNEHNKLHKYDCFYNSDSINNITQVFQQELQTQNTQKGMGLTLNMSSDIDTNKQTNHTNGKSTFILFFYYFFICTCFFIVKFLIHLFAHKIKNNL